QIALAAAYAEGRGVARDDAEAARWYRRAADANHAAAVLTLGWIYIDGRGVPRDEAAGIALHERVAAFGDRGTLNALAWGRAVRAVDLGNALRWATRAVQAQPDGYAGLDILALVQFRSGMLEEALATQTRTVALRPDCGGCVGRLGDILAALGRVDE